MKKIWILVMTIIVSLSAFAKDIPLSVTQTEWGFEVSNLDAKGKRICKGGLVFEEQNDVFVILKTNNDNFSLEEFAHEFVYSYLSNTLVLTDTNLSTASKDKKNLYGPMSNYDSILVISSYGKIGECVAYSDGKNLQLKFSDNKGNAETKITRLIKTYISEKEKVEAERRAENARLAVENFAAKFKYHNNSYCYDITKDGDIEIKAYIGSEVDVLEIPEKIEGIPVTSIYSISSPCVISFQKVIIPKTIKIIHDEAFLGIKIKSLMFAENTSVSFIAIREKAFCNCEIESIKLPSQKNGYIYVGQRAFSGCNIKKLIYPKAFNFSGMVTAEEAGENSPWEKPYWHCSQGIFRGNQSIEEVVFEDGCEFVPALCFCRCKNLRKVTLPSSIVLIGRSAFYECDSLEEVIFDETKMKLNSFNRIRSDGKWWSDVSKHYIFPDMGAFYGCPLPLGTKSRLLKAGLKDRPFEKNTLPMDGLHQFFQD